MTRYVPLDRGDLRGFDREASDLILWAQEQGARIRISKRGHALVYAPQGGTASVPPKMKSNNRSAKNTHADVNRLFKESR